MNRLIALCSGLVLLAPLAAETADNQPATAPRAEVEPVAPTASSAQPVSEAGVTAPGAPLTADSAPSEAGMPAATAATPPLDRVRYAPPTDLPPLVGYAPQAGQPLPSYPGIPAAADGAVGYPSLVPSSGQLSSLFTDLKASQVGDVLTIVVTQQAVAAANAQKQSGRDASISFDGGAGVLSFLPGFNLNYGSSSSGATNDTGGFNVATTFTVTVVGVAPNGNLLVEGQQVVNMDGRDQWVKLSGEVRPYDVRQDNTVESTRVANVQIEFVGIRAKQKRKGILDVIGGAIEGLFGIFF